MSPDGVWAYVANFESNSVSVIASARNEVVAEIPVGEGPVGLAVSPDGRFVYSGNFKAGSLSIVDTAERREVAAVPTGAETFGVGLRPSGKEIYAASGKERQVVVVDTQLKVVRQKAMLGQGPFKLQWLLKRLRAAVEASVDASVRSISSRFAAGLFSESKAFEDALSVLPYRGFRLRPGTSRRRAGLGNPRL
jgi:YVTN family beta-propeller protein